MRPVPSIICFKRNVTQGNYNLVGLYRNDNTSSRNKLTHLLRRVPVRRAMAPEKGGSPTPNPPRMPEGNAQKSDNFRTSRKNGYFYSIKGRFISRFDQHKTHLMDALAIFARLRSPTATKKAPDTARNGNSPLFLAENGAYLLPQSFPFYR
ncbi:hypothetical protein [Insolitispirillum peregrinum]|uniref:hypothetical protein n=1 Tax=Insolitispirillum peregrinum TaxID=80876 RepID=UPI0011156B1C|nr:hypothetical protein [Insolitispirillum peregrinum]